jgi:hypothetical protein
VRRYAHRAAGLALAALLPLLGACATGGAAGAGAPLPVPSSEARWPVRTVEHVDLWLHVFALLDADSAPVPLFRRSYRDTAIVARNARGITTRLDAARDSLAGRLRANAALQGAQFLPFQFPSWPVMRAAITLFGQTEGDPRRAGDQQGAQVVAWLARQFPAAADRAWLVQLAGVADDERTRFFADWWAEQQRERVPVLDALEVAWQATWRDRFDRLLGATNQRFGTFVPSLPLGPEGRATPESADGRPMIAVPFPARAADATEAILVFAHEAVGGIAATAVADNTTPAEKRAGVADRLVAFAQVEAGRAFLERAAPALEVPYARYYLRQGGHAVPPGDDRVALAAALAAAHPVPELVREAITRQLGIILGGI